MLFAFLFCAISFLLTSIITAYLFITKRLFCLFLVLPHQNITGMKLIFTFVALLLFASTGFPQNSTSVKGTIQDKSGKPIEAATVTILQAKDSSLYKAAVSNKGGEYAFEKIKPGKYFIKFSSISHNPYATAVFELKEAETLNIPVINLAASEKKLKDVVVTTTKPMIEVKADRTVFNVENSINATGSTAMELLQKAPGVLVDKDDNISMKGKNGVRIYIDGKLSPMASADLAAYLRSIQSADIESIEMIENPSAKYDASGNAGIINIKLKKNKKYGTNGNLAVGANQGFYPKYNGSLGLNYRNQKINLFSNVSVNQGKMRGWQDFNRQQNDSIYDAKSVSVGDNTGANVKLGADYFVNSKSTVGVMFTGNYLSGTRNTDGNTLISSQSTKIPTQILVARNLIDIGRNNSNLNLNYRYADTAGRELNIDADRGIYRGTGESFQPNFYTDANSNIVLRARIFANNTPTNIDIYTSKADYEQNLFKGKFGTGIKYSKVKTDNTFDFFNVFNDTKVKDYERSNQFTYTENVNAAYVNYNRSFKKFSYQAGLRAEQTKSNGVLNAKSRWSDTDTIESVKRSYLDFFPSAAFSYTLNAKHQFNINYSRRIDRPRYQDLNPFENKLDELTYQKGNAFLRPQYTNSYTIGHTYKSFLSSSLGYSHIKDYFTVINDTARGNASFITLKNLAAQDIYSFNVSAPFNIAKWWNVYANVNANHSRYKANFDDGKIIRLNITTISYYNQHTFTLGKGYTGELSGWFNTPSVWGGTFKTRFMWSADAGVQKVIMNKKATIKLSVTDLFYTAKWNAVSNFAGSIFNAKGGYESQQVRLNFSYRFGSNQVKAARNRKTSAEAESNRLGGS